MPLSSTGGGDPASYLDNTLLADYQYTLAADENVRLDSGLYRTSALDWLYGLGQLVRESLDGSDDALDYTTDYFFDLVGNRVEKGTFWFS